jgi:hypothetical protein
LAAANYTLLEMVSFALSIWFQALLASLWMLGYSKSHPVSGYRLCFLRWVLRSVECWCYTMKVFFHNSCECCRLVNLKGHNLW